NSSSLLPIGRRHRCRLSTAEPSNCSKTTGRTTSTTGSTKPLTRHRKSEPPARIRASERSVLTGMTSATTTRGDRLADSYHRLMTAVDDEERRYAARCLRMLEDDD